MTWKGLDSRRSLPFLPLYLGASGMWPAAMGELEDGLEPSIPRAKTYSIVPSVWASFTTSFAYAHLTVKACLSLYRQHFHLLLASISLSAGLWFWQATPRWRSGSRGYQLEHLYSTASEAFVQTQEENSRISSLFFTLENLVHAITEEGVWTIRQPPQQSEDL